MEGGAEGAVESFARPAAAAEGQTVQHPERDLQPGDPNLVGAEAKEEKKGIKGKVKGLFHRKGRKSKDAQHGSGVTGKLKAKMDKKVGHGEVDEEGNPKQGVARLLSMSSSTSSLSSSDEEDIGTVGFAMDPTQPAVAGLHLGREDFTSAPTGPGADLSKINLLKSDADATTEEHAKRAREYAEVSDPIQNPEGFNQVPHRGVEGHQNHGGVEGNSNYGGVEGNSNYGGVEGNSNYGGVDRSHGGNSSLNSNDGDGYGAPDRSHSTDVDDSKWKHGEGAGHIEPHTSRIASDGGEPRPTNPTGVTNPAGGAVLNNHQGPREDGVKQEGFMSKIMDTFRGTKEEPAATSRD